MSIYADTVHAMMHALRLHRGLCEKRIGELGLHPAQHRMLMHLEKIGQIPSQRELAERFHVSAAAVAVTLKKLESAGYIQRTPSDSDQRKNGISITGKGKEIVKKTKDIFNDTDMTMFKGISQDELHGFIACLKKINDNLGGNR